MVAVGICPLVNDTSDGKYDIVINLKGGSKQTCIGVMSGKEVNRECFSPF